MHRRHHQAGDAYLLRADTTAHRVSPLTRPGVRRTVLNVAYSVPGRQAPRSPSAPASLGGRERHRQGEANRGGTERRDKQCG
ncbi:HalD/BesD family halogenase [Streptomyces melanogenes]|uniref:HalD/BesD family halogenase n=1 Tax=Streptomyces melanogenes TaxID=67326 RepID=UPI003AF3BA40